MKIELIPDYTFDSFKLTDSNKRAYDAALKVANDLGKCYNPLIIYDKFDNTKTHLLHAIGNHIAETSDKKILYINGETINDDIDVYVDVILVDNVQNIIGNPKLEYNLLQLFDKLHSQDKQIVLASNIFYNHLVFSNETLKTRFGWGLPIEINSLVTLKSSNVLNGNTTFPDGMKVKLYSKQGTLLFIMGEPKTGKTAMLIKIMKILLGLKKNVLFVSLQNNKKELEYRFGESINNIKHLTIKDSINSIDEVVNIVKQNDIKILLIDFIQLIPSGTNEARAFAMDYIIYKLKYMSDELGLSVIVTSLLVGNKVIARKYTENSDSIILIEK